MIQGTTPTHTFNLPFTTDTISALRIAYEQSGKVVLTKETNDVETTSKTITVKLTQEETLKFDANVPVRIQLHVRMEDDTTMASVVETVPVYILLDRRVL